MIQKRIVLRGLWTKLCLRIVHTADPSLRYSKTTLPVAETVQIMAFLGAGA
jgi:hypothetical protein